jgi:hypothetical protein
MIYNKTILAQMYGVSYNTFKRWLKRIPNLQLSAGQRVLTPRQVEVIFDYLGRPKNINKQT